MEYLDSLFVLEYVLVPNPKQFMYTDSPFPDGIESYGIVNFINVRGVGSIDLPLGLKSFRSLIFKDILVVQCEL